MQLSQREQQLMELSDHRVTGEECVLLFFGTHSLTLNEKALDVWTR